MYVCTGTIHDEPRNVLAVPDFDPYEWIIGIEAAW